MEPNEFEGSPKTWPPLGMPTGSVRALLGLLVVAVVVTKMARGDNFQTEHDKLWIVTLLISLTHYFTSRRFVALSPDIRRQLEDDGILERERHPLFLPRNSIRVIIIGAFGWLAYYLFTHDRLQENHVGSLLAMMTAFLVGAMFRGIGNWWRGYRTQKSAGTWGDLKALAVLGALTLASIPEFLDKQDDVPAVFYRVALGMTLFYFGSR
jgi:hypothetical protein